MKTKTKKIKTYYVKKGGWTKWVYPIMNGYQFECCDCGLVHKFQFEVVTTTKEIMLRFRVK